MAVLSCLDEFEANPGTWDPGSEKQIKDRLQRAHTMATGQLLPTSAVTAAVVSVPGVLSPSLTIGVVAWSFLHHVWRREVRTLQRVSREEIRGSLLSPMFVRAI